jgi:hypothetical protein
MSPKSEDEGLTRRSWDAVIWHGGWRTNCFRSPLPGKGTPPHNIEDTEGWEPAGHDREPREGYEYALAHTCTRPGGPGAAEWQYWSRWKRPIPQPAIVRVAKSA